VTPLGRPASRVCSVPHGSGAQFLDLAPQFIRDDRLVAAGEEVVAVTNHPAIEGIPQRLPHTRLRPSRAPHRADTGLVQLSRDRRLRFAADVVLEHSADNRRFIRHDFKRARRDAIHHAWDVLVPEGARAAVPSAAFSRTSLARPRVRRLRP
jgi:hypothetical protein